jgi:hypothetical protein
MSRKSRDAYGDALGLREVETSVSDTFEMEFPIVTDRTVEVLSAGESPDRVALIDGIEIGVELTSIKADGPDRIVAEVLRLARKKHESYQRRGIFNSRSIILLGHLDWPAIDAEGLALYDLHDELAKRIVHSDFDGFAFSEIWLMDDGPKYTSRRDPRAPADFFCFAPTEKFGFWGCERKRRPYWGLINDFLS